MKTMQMVLVLAAVVLATACARPFPSETAAGPAEHGKYLAESVAMCADCHTPRNERGEMDTKRWLRGTTIDFQPIHPVPDWAREAPGIAGLPKLGDAAVIRLLETGELPDGHRARPPMPPYRMSHADAVAVAAYLKTLPRQP